MRLFQSSGVGLLIVYESPQYMGATAGYNSPTLSWSSLKAVPQFLPFLLKLSCPSTMSTNTPIISPAATVAPYLGPLELLPCLNSPL